VLGPDAEIGGELPYDLAPLQRLFLYTRADTIYGGSNEIQRNVIGERALGLPPEPKVNA
jgi:alkylation response protein AidB-like acyl-CoA dehydrogenase